MFSVQTLDNLQAIYMDDDNPSVTMLGILE